MGKRPYSGRLRLQQDAELDIANALWAGSEFTIAPEFILACQEIYDAAVRTLDLKQPSAAAVINEWVAQKTRGKISQIVTSAVIATLPAVLTNAIYFKGKFLNPFRREATQPRTFYLATGSKKLVPMMEKTGLVHSYRSGKTSEVATLQYRNSNIVLFMILPRRGISPEESLTEDVTKLTVERGEELDLLMPRFTIEYSSGLKESLAGMGMGIAFQHPGADFSRIGSSFYISDVLHKTLLEVDEEGTVAAAATAVVIAGASESPRVPRRRRLIFDRPFAVVLKDYTSGATLFAGVVYEP
jgi:serine protease inhibitor